MKFKSPSNKPVYIALLSGHSAYVGNEWRELPLLMHREALAAGCITDNMDEASIAAKVESAKPEKDRHQILVATIKSMMDEGKPGYFTAADLPNMKTLNKLAGWIVSKEDMMQAVHAIAAEDESE